MSGFGEIVSADVTGDVNVPGPDIWPGGPLYVLLYTSAGSCTVQLEATADDIAGWVPVGEAVTSDGLYRREMPHGLEYRLRVYNSAGLSGHVDIFTE